MKQSSVDVNFHKIQLIYLSKKIVQLRDKSNVKQNPKNAD
jgi:hypothetical protein